MKLTFQKLRRQSGVLYHRASAESMPGIRCDSHGNPRRTGQWSWERLAVLQLVIVPAASLPASVHPALIATELLHLTSALREKISPVGLRYLKRTSDGLIGVYDDPAAALNAARHLRRRKPSPGIRVRYALYWGDTYISADGTPSGGEPQLLRQLLFLQKENRATPHMEVQYPDRDRVLIPFGSVVQLPVELRAQFTPLGLFHVTGYDCPIEVWTENLASFLGREPTNSERMFGVDGLHRDTVLDMWRERRYEILEKTFKR